MKLPHPSRSTATLLEFWGVLGAVVLFWAACAAIGGPR
jgi:hypothetical protein